MDVYNKLFNINTYRLPNILFVFY